MTTLQGFANRPTDLSSRLNISIIDGSAGLRLLLATLIKTRYPNAAIEEIDPFSQTTLGAGFLFGTRGDVIILGGLGTRKEALDAIARLTGREQCPPIIVLAAKELTQQSDALIAAGAFDVLRKDVLSSARLHRSIARAAATAVGAGAPTLSAIAAGEPVSVYADPGTNFGEFLYVAQGNRTVVEIDGYRCLSTLASGTLAEVFFAEHIDGGDKVVIKLMTASPLGNMDAINAICARLRLLGAVDHPHIVNTLDVGVTNGLSYVVMEYLAQGDLRRRMKQTVDTAATLTIMAGILDALNALHTLGLVHADVKPESIFFRPDGSVVLIDFDIATPTGHAATGSKAEKGGRVLGTPAYVSPEQGAGLPIAATADIYSAGIIFMELLTGDVPFSGDTPAQVIFRHIHDEIPLLPLRIRHLQPLIDQMLAKRPSDRFQSAAAVTHALQAFLPAPATGNTL